MRSKTFELSKGWWLSVALALVVVGCSDSDNFQERAEPEFVLDGTDGQIRLTLPTDDKRHQNQLQRVIIRNAGDSPLQVKRLEFVSKPDRLVTKGDVGGPCSDDSECPDGICLTTSQTCVNVGLPVTPFLIEPNLRKDVDFVVTKGDGELICPEPIGDVPESVRADYCGELVIETNAINDSGTVVSGQATVYFLDPGVYGKLLLNPDFMEFGQVSPGSTQSQDFSIQNDGTRPLEITGLTLQDKGSWFTISEGPSLPVSIENGENVVWKLTLSPPADAPPEELDFDSQLVIESSAVNAVSGRIPIEVSAGVGSAPQIQVEPTVLSFDAAAVQLFTVSNIGNATLQLRSFRIQPESASGFYTFTIDGNAVDLNNFERTNVAKQTSLEVGVTFGRPAGNVEESVGVLTIEHNDENSSFASEVILLGDAGDVAIGEVQPGGFSFLASGSHTSTRHFIIRNRGTAPLNVTDVGFNFSTGSEAEFQVNNAVGTVAPGGLSTGTVTFSGLNNVADAGEVIFESNSVGESLAIGLTAIDSTQDAPVPVITPLFSNDARVGQQARFSASESTPTGVEETAAIWMLLERPAASAIYMFTAGVEAAFLPDVPGAYKLALLVVANGREAQATYEVTVVE
jgi:hypothetical protein